MDDQINNLQTDGNGNIMRELSIIKSSLAVQTSETVNIKESIGEIKMDIKEIKSNYINQEQHKALMTDVSDHEERIRNNSENITKIKTWGSAMIVIIGIIEFILMKFF